MTKKQSAKNNPMRHHDKKLRSELTPKDALQYLKEGNFRFVNALNRDHDHLQMINETSEEQWPFAAIVSCMDSRTSAELIFDQSLGNIFSIRIAGHIITQNVLGSLEYACKIAGSKLIVIVGHTKCGAIRGACDDVRLGNLTKLLSYIKPAVEEEKTVTEERSSTNPEFVEKVCDLHLYRSVESLLQESPILREMIENGEIGTVPAKYNIETGRVVFYEKNGFFNQKDSKSFLIS